MTKTDLGEAVVDHFTKGGVDDPTELYERLFTEDPVLRFPLDGSWLVTSFDLATSVLADSEHFKRGDAAELNGMAKDVEELRVRMVLQDDPAHARLRGLVNRAFTPRAVSKLRDEAVAVARRLVAAVHERGTMSVPQDFSYPFTVDLIATKLGIPLEDGPKIIEWTAAKLARTQNDAAVRNAQDAAAEMTEYLQRYAQAADGEGSEGIIKALAQAEVDGDRLSKVELTAVCWELVSAGHETTANMIPNALYTLLRHPEQLELVRADRSLIPGAVEECLRFEPPLQLAHAYTAASDVEVGGTQIAAGERVRVCLAAANRDPAVFADPNRFDVTRANSRQHLAFSYGSHFCIGAALARMEIAVALDELLHLPDLALADPPAEWMPMGLRILKNLDVEWSNAGR